MSIPILILGLSGSGKSTSIRTLPPNETFLINVCSKELPFRGSRKNYTEWNKENPTGNMLSSNDYVLIDKLFTNIDIKRKEIKYIVIDDSQYLLTAEYMKRAHEKGYEKFTEIGEHFWNILWASKMLRQDLFVFFLHHSEINELGITKVKSVGKMLDEKVNIEGMFTIVLLAKRDSDKNYFITQNDGTTPAKSPIGMFEDRMIDNDLKLVVDSINNYYEGE